MAFVSMVAHGNQLFGPGNLIFQSRARGFVEMSPDGRLLQLIEKPPIPSLVPLAVAVGDQKLWVIGYPYTGPNSTSYLYEYRARTGEWHEHKGVFKHALAYAASGVLDICYLGPDRLWLTSKNDLASPINKTRVLNTRTSKFGVGPTLQFNVRDLSRDYEGAVWAVQRMDSAMLFTRFDANTLIPSGHFTVSYPLASHFTRVDHDSWVAADVSLNDPSVVFRQSGSLIRRLNHKPNASVRLIGGGVATAVWHEGIRILRPDWTESLFVRDWYSRFQTLDIVPAERPRTWVFEPRDIQGGEQGSATLYLNSPASTTVSVPLRSNSPLLIVPPTVTIPKGAHSVRVDFQTLSTSIPVEARVSGPGFSEMVKIWPKTPLSIRLVKGHPIATNSLDFELQTTPTPYARDVALSVDLIGYGYPRVGTLAPNTSAFRFTVQLDPFAGSAPMKVSARVGASKASSTLRVTARPMIESLTVPASIVGGLAFDLGIWLSGPVPNKWEPYELDTPLSHGAKIVAFAAGQSERTVQLVAPKTDVAVRETLTVRHPFGPAKTVTFTILPSPQLWLAIEPDRVFGGASSQARFSWSNPPQTFRTIWLTASGTEVRVPRHLRLIPGQGQANIELLTSRVTAARTRTVTATHFGLTATDTLTILP